MTARARAVTAAKTPSPTREDAFAQHDRCDGRAADRIQLPPGVDLSAYRIVQEALTNVLKYAGRAQAEVVVRYDPSALELQINDDGSDAPANLNGSGHGLIGMRERVALYGGALEAGSRNGGGYAVRVRLPLTGGPR